MLAIRPSIIAAAIKAAPPSIVLGLLVRDERLRDRSTYALAEVIADRLEPRLEPDPDQLKLSLQRPVGGAVGRPALLVPREKLILWSVCALHQRAGQATDAPMKPDCLRQRRSVRMTD